MSSEKSPEDNPPIQRACPIRTVDIQQPQGLARRGFAPVTTPRGKALLAKQ